MKGYFSGDFKRNASIVVAGAPRNPESARPELMVTFFGGSR
jgi:hypothetical protein